MKKFTVLIFLFLAILLMSCGIQKGYVYDKNYYAPWTQLIGGYTSEDCEKIGQSEECTLVFHPPISIYHEAIWELDISNCDGKQTSSCEQNAIDVSQGIYDKTQIGDYVNLGDN